ncbi:MAG: hypothetical protein ACXVEE_20360 [Polyangiales bacterium]
MRAHRWIGALTVCTGGLLAAVVLSAGCGGKSEDAPVVETDTGSDTGIVIVKDTSTPVDTGTAVEDAPEGFDVPGSLFDAEIPDITLEGGYTVKGCYDCTLDKCKTEVAACDKDERCRGLLLCALTTCSSFSDTACLFGCAVMFGVTSPSDPIVATLQSVGSCNQKNCSASCPGIPDAGGGGDASKSDATKSDGATATDGSTGDAMAMMLFPKGSSKHVDAKVIEVLQSVMTSFDSTPLASQGLIDHLSH